MFPGGVDESRKELDYAHRVFDENEDHTAHPRTQQHHHHHHAPTARSLEIKREQMEERRFADTQSPGNGDVDMDRPEDHADDEGQTPGGQSDHSGHGTQYHEAVNGQAQPASSEPGSEPAPAPAVNTTSESSATLPPASSTQTLTSGSA
jgi:hypothetical protein